MANIGYVDLEYANEYVSLHFLSEDDLRVSWESLYDTDKEVLLRQSLEAIETLRFTGAKSSPEQKLAFPRFPSNEVPELVKMAQVENAIALSDSTTTEESSFYERLYRFGVSSYSIGNLSESLGSGMVDGLDAVVSSRALRLLKPLLSGGYSIRRSRA